MQGIELSWLGQAGFRLRDLAGSVTLYLDPFLTHRDDRTWPAPIGPEALALADGVLCTHEHRDHFDRPTLAKAASVPESRFTLLVPRPLLPDALELGLPPSRVIGVQPNQELQLGPARIFPVPARHGVTVADAYSFGEALSGGDVRFLGFVVELGGVRIYHAGDCIPYEGQVGAVRALRPEVALLPINGRDFFRETEHNLVGNMNPREAARLAVEIGVHTLVPMHWELFERNKGFPSDLVRCVADEYPQLTVLTMGRGARATFIPANLI